MVTLNSGTYAAIVIADIIAISLVVIIIYYYVYVKRKSSRQTAECNSIREVPTDNLIRFSAQQLDSFTNNYSTRLGSGGFGVVYKGNLPNGIPIAVKVLKKKTTEAAKQHFMNKVATISTMNHINLLKLYGFCYDNLKVAIVYEYMENGSLDKYLYTDTGRAIEWGKLYEVAVGTARGIAFLHEESQPRIIHYDIKPANVLLDGNFSPKVADFGLAKLSNRDGTHINVTDYRGTPGYSAPEFLLHNFPITSKCDVYSFGMLLFEIVGRRRNVQTTCSDNSMDWLPKRVWEEYENGGLDKMVECNLGIEDKDRKKAERVAMVALWCVQDSPDARPAMIDVVKMLEGEIEILPPQKPFSYMFPTSRKTYSTSLEESTVITYESTSSYRGDHNVRLA